MKKMDVILQVGLWCLPVILTAQNSHPFTPSENINNSVRIYNTSRINTESLEFCPAIYENGMVYVSRYKNGPIDPHTGETFFELFYAEFDPNGLPGNPESFSREINSAYHEGPVSFSRSGDRLFFTRTNTNKGVRRAGRKGRSGLKIYEADRGLFDWENVRELSFNSDDYTCMHPALSSDEKRLFFASDRPGGYGGMDLYMVEWNGNKWSTPINLGAEVNTSTNEAFPFFHESGVLFFASDGHNGLGGLDLFLVDMSERKWSEVYNLGPPFNSSADDLGLVILPDGQQGYFTSARTGGFGQDDIYMFTAENGLKGVRSASPVRGEVLVKDETARGVSGVSIRLFELTDEGLLADERLYDLELMPSDSSETEMVIKMVRKKDDALGAPLGITDRDGESIIDLASDKDYLLLASKPGYFTEELRFSTSEEGSNTPLNITFRPNDCVTLSGFVHSDKFRIPVPNAKLTLTNQCNGEVTDFRTNILGEYEVCLPMGCDFIVEGSKNGYEDGAVQVSTIRLRGSRSLTADVPIHATSDEVLREPIKEGTIIVLDNIYYDFNKSAIRKGAVYDLEALAQLMDLFPSMQVELGAHTDSRGTDDYNRNLSNRRAESAKEFLIQHGISSERVRAVGYGESFLRNDCDDGVECAENQHQVNRRTEVKVISIDEKSHLEETTE